MSSLNIWKENPPRIKPLLVHFLTVPGIQKKKRGNDRVIISTGGDGLTADSDDRIKKQTQQQ